MDDYQGNSDFSYHVRHNDKILTYLISQIPINQFSEMNLLILNQAAVTIELELMKKNIWFEKELEDTVRIFEKILDHNNEKDIFTLFNSRPDFIYCLIIDDLEFPLWSKRNSFEKERFFENWKVH
ncbi:hypothetical protein [Sinobaca sp. H24]|uniref:hypothetical protein n=1 Tax=Sinobaca sp. H24 TaxID=2923376 RepID=UPI002079B8F0|nr:hypothetical protein [Sinobaca sp. H24]